ncbi:hypothetical protein [Spiroplasma eriocheiris]|uniref:hypothetical protein n=1 Tax=Spiroplasma eriocheiris TaxID=315358 RepID=UPI0011DDB239|nr:hypothetical protein [Spiroplasma eriocheiris]
MIFYSALVGWGCCSHWLGCGWTGPYFPTKIKIPPINPEKINDTTPAAILLFACPLNTSEHKIMGAIWTQQKIIKKIPIPIPVDLTMSGSISGCGPVLTTLSANVAPVKRQLH